MLVIRRKPGETLVIGHGVEIEVLESTGSHVKLGIRAPKEIAVVRKEVLLTSQQNQLAARAIPNSTVESLFRQLKSPSLKPISPV